VSEKITEGGNRSWMTLHFSSSLKAGLRADGAIVAGILAAILTIGEVLHAQVAPANIEGLLSRAVDLEKSKDYAGAEGAYRQALLNSPDDPEILKRLGVVCQEQGKYEESIEVFHKILKRAPVYPGVNSLLAISYYALNKFDKTVEASQKELTGNERQAGTLLPSSSSQRLRPVLRCHPAP